MFSRLWAFSVSLNYHAFEFYNNMFCREIAIIANVIRYNVSDVK